MNMTSLEKLNAHNPQKLLLTVKEMAEILGIGVTYAYRLVNTKGFPVLRLGPRQIRIPFEGLKRWIEKMTAGGDELYDKISNF